MFRLKTITYAENKPLFEVPRTSEKTHWTVHLKINQQGDKFNTYELFKKKSSNMYHYVGVTYGIRNIVPLEKWDVKN